LVPIRQVLLDQALLEERQVEVVVAAVGEVVAAARVVSSDLELPLLRRRPQLSLHLKTMETPQAPAPVQ
jgi:hypothetical protein